MCNHHHHAQPSQCVIPPYVGEKLKKSRNSDIAVKATKSEQNAADLRSRRNMTMLATAPKKPQPAAPPATLNMQVYDIKHATDFAAADLLWQNGNALKPLDSDASNVIAAGTATWDFYYKLFGRNSINNLGMLIKHYVHYGNTESEIDNAMWDGSEMVYGDGDGKVFGSFTTDADIIGHELTHGVTQYEANLRYHMQSGALNESLSDVFGIMIKQRMNNQDVKTSNWLIGENVLLGSNYALRSMSAPGTAYKSHPELGDDPQPATMDNFVMKTDDYDGDWGGVHFNSGIPNYAFYVAAYNIGGFAWEKAGRIWYDAMTSNQLKSTASFADFKALTIEKAETLFGIGSNEATAVKQGWDAAKV